MSKLNLLVAQGTGFNAQYNFDLALAVQNFDTAAVPLSAVRIVSYAWLQETNIGTQFTSGVNSLGTFYPLSSAAFANSSSQTGIVSLALSATTFRVYHNATNIDLVAPLLSLNAPNGQSSNIVSIAYTNNNPTYFDIVLDDFIPTSGYSVSWFIPSNPYITTLPIAVTSTPSITIQKIPEYIRTKSGKYDSQIIVSWPNSIENIPQNWGLSGTDVYVNINPGLFLSSYITSSWYSSPTSTNFLDNSGFVLQQYNGSSWQTVQEYIDSNDLDPNTGIVPVDNNFIKLVNSATGSNTSVYISVSSSNPISAGYANSNKLLIGTKSVGDNRSRSLIKFDTTSIPTSAPSIKSAILRLNTESIYNATYPATNGYVAVYQLSSSWVENQATWNNRTSGSTWNNPGGDYIPTPSVWYGNSNLVNNTSGSSATAFWMDFDVTNIVNNWKNNPASNYGFLLRLYDDSNENSSTSSTFIFDSGRSAGSGIIPGYPELLISYNSLNTSAPIPSATITYPSTNSSVTQSTFTINVSTSISAGSVDSVSAYYRPTNAVSPFQFLGILSQTSLGNWSNTFSALSSGSYDFVVRALSDSQNTAQSQTVTISFLSVPAITVTSNSICHSENITINGTIDITNGSPVSGSISYVNQYIPNNHKITCLLEDRLNPGVVWVGTDGNGLYRINRATQLVTSFTQQNTSISYSNISDMSMDSNGIIWLSYTGNGIGTFNSKNWSAQTSNDWNLYNTTNSSLSAYPANSIDVCDVYIDSNDVKYLALTWDNVNSVIALSGYIFNDQYITKYNPGIYPRKVLANSGTIYVATSDNRISKYSSGSWTNYSLPTFQNINDFALDSFGTLWIATDSGIATLSGSTFIENSISATPAWPNGLNSGFGHLGNIQAKSISIASGNNKFIGYSGGENSYNGGFVKYIGSNLSTVTSGWSVYDVSNYSGLLSNNVNKILVTTADNYIWTGTDIGVGCIQNNGSVVWQNFSNDNINSPLSIDGNTWTVEIDSPIYGNTGYVVSFTYPGNIVYTSSFNLPTEKAINLLLTYPTNNLLIVAANQSQQVLQYSINNYDDVSNGDTIQTVIQKSSSPNGPWTTYYTYNNSLFESVYENSPAQTFYYARVVASNNNCSAVAGPVGIYFNNPATINTTPVVGNNYTNSIIKFLGNVSDLDFVNSVNVNGSSYTDSLQNVSFVYTSAGNVVSIGNATIGSLNGTSASFEFDWSSPIAGVSQVSAIAQTNYGSSAIASYSFNTVVAVPSVTIISPFFNQYVAYNSPFSLSASTQYITNSVSSVNFYIQSATSNLLVGSATSAGSNWTKTFTPSAVLTPGYFSVIAIATDISGNSATSNPVNFLLNTPPTLNQISPLSATVNGVYTYQAQVVDVDSPYNNRVDILSAGNILYTTYANGFGNVNLPWTYPVSGVFSLSAKVYDGNPNVSSDYTILPLNFNLSNISINLTSQAFPLAKYNGVVLSPSVNVITTNTIVNLSANTTGNSISNVNFWLCEYDIASNAFLKSYTLSSDNSYPYTASVTLPSSRYYSGNNQSQYRLWGILAESTSTNGSIFDSNLLQFYVKEQLITASIQNSTCSNPIIFTGNFLDSDVALVPGTTIIDDSVSAVIYDGTHNTYLGTLISGVGRTGESVPFSYYYQNPTSSVSAVKFYVNDLYGNSTSALINYGLINQVPYINLLSSTNYYSYNSNFRTFLTSAGPLTLSSTTSGSNISLVEYLIANSTIQTTLSATNNSATYILPASNDITSVYSEVFNAGNCNSYSNNFSYLTLQNVSANILPNNCASCYCNGTALSISGNYTDPNFGNTYLTSIFGYSVSAILYDNFNNVVQDISSQLTQTTATQTWQASWAVPTVNATSVYLKVTNKFGVVQTISQNLFRQISQAPSLVLSSPVNGAIYNQSTPINFTVSTSGSDINAIKIYSNGNLLAVQTNVFNGTIYSWSGDKLPGVYSVSAIVLTNGGCFAVSSDQITIANGPVTYFQTPIAGNYYSVGQPLPVIVDVKGNLPATISAVNIISNPGTTVSATNIGGSLWTTTLSALSNFVSAYNISAIAYDTLGQTTKISQSIFVGTLPNISASISGTTSANSNFNQFITVNVSGHSNTGGYVSAAYLNISGTYVGLTSSFANNFSGNILASQYLIPGQTNILTATVVDSNGAQNYQNLYVYVNNFSGQTSYPVIEILSVDPPGKTTYQILPSR